MLYHMLLPNWCKRVGWVILFPAAVAGIFVIASGFEASWLHARVPVLLADQFPGGPRAFSLIDVNITNTLVGATFLVGALLVAFSKEKQEDEYIRMIRYSSLMWAVWVNQLLLLAGMLLVYGLSFLHVMIYNMFTIPVFFIIRYHVLFFKTRHAIPDEK